MRLQTAPTGLGPPKLTLMVRFVTAPCRLRKWVSDAYSLRSGAVTNRTYRVGAKRLQTAPTSLRSGAVTNRTYWGGAKRLQTAPTGVELSGSKPHLLP